VVHWTNFIHHHHLVQHVFGCAFANVKQNVHAAMRHTIVERAKF